MKRLLLLLPFLVGCQSDRLFGPPRHHSQPPQIATLTTVSCCTNYVNGIAIYPASVPQSHRDFCAQVAAANRADQQINGVLYLGMSVDCGYGHHDIGDEFYTGNPLYGS